MSTPKVSILVPVYRTEQELSRCLDCIINQTYFNWECICVNDGSPDGSAHILREYCAKDKRFKVIDQENQGLSTARNTAMEALRGDYVIFVDSDDFIHPQLLEICVHQALRDDSDVVVFRHSHLYRNLTRVLHFLNLKEYMPRFKRYDKENIPTVTTNNIFSYATNRSHKKLPGIDNRFRVKHCQVWRNLYRASTIAGIKFYPGINFQDIPWWGEVLLHIEKATINNLPLYFYYPGKTSFHSSADGKKKIRQLKLAIPIAEKVYENAGTEEQKRIWQDRFIAPAKELLKKKIKKYGDAD